ncbi:MAG TPA: hypothetical protein VI072_29185 [Polyangiaceae bacterium]
MRFTIATLCGLALGACAGRSERAGTRAVTQHIYVVNTESESLSVIEHESARVIDTIALGERPHGQAPSSGDGRVYVTTDGEQGEVIAIDAKSRAIAWRLDVGGALNEPHLTRDARFLFAPDLLGARTAIIDVKAQALVGEVSMRDPSDDSALVALHNTYASHDGTRMYVTAILSHKIAEIDVESRQLTRIFALSGAPRPAAITRDDRKMYVQLSDLHGFIELDLETGEETARVEWPDDGRRPPGYDAGPLLTKCHGIGLTPDGQELWAASNIEGNVRVYSTPDLRELAVVTVGTMPNWIAFSRDGATAYVTNTDPAAGHGTVSVIDVRARRVTATLAVGRAPKRVHRIDIARH